MQIVILSGLSGAGKTLASDCFEDMGFFCIDNMPPVLIKDFVALTQTGKHKIDKIALVIDIRGGDFLDDFKKYRKMLDRRNIDFKLIYLEAPKSTILRRFAETRRTHPLAAESGMTNGEALDEEIKRLAPIKEMADLIIDTGDLKSAELASILHEYVTGGDVQGVAKARPFRIVVQSFGYKYGMPQEADFIFDVRFIPNPFYVDALREMTGRDEAVRTFVMDFPESKFLADEILMLIERLKPSYIKEGKPSLNIAFGCTGGQHRSVAMAIEVAERLRDAGENIVLRHREV
ncbi:MAG: RNase adapter RapZ [Clostridiales Family XIII bacterium]|jgi:UPF0042 nucleotide-binding protein|nr:RNase adapter RapZ [Clostridiales Family XIII bacterium]